VRHELAPFKSCLACLRYFVPTIVSRTIHLNVNDLQLLLSQEYRMIRMLGRQLHKLATMTSNFCRDKKLVSYS
jgi:hypothetical protein